MSVYIAMKNVLVPLLETVITLRISDQLLKFSHEDGMTLEIRDECVRPLHISAVGHGQSVASTFTGSLRRKSVLHVIL